MERRANTFEVVGRLREDGYVGEVELRGMPTVLRVRSYRFFFVSLDGSEPPHVHVRREKMVSKFWLDPVALERAGGFSRHEVNVIANLVRDHREELIESWHEFFGH
jgi:hypothetical protein